MIYLDVRYLQSLASSTSSSALPSGSQSVAHNGVVQQSEPACADKPSLKKHRVDINLETLIDFQNLQRVAGPSQNRSEPVNFRKRPNYDNSGRALRMKQYARTPSLVEP